MRARMWSPAVMGGKRGGRAALWQGSRQVMTASRLGLEQHRRVAVALRGRAARVHHAVGRRAELAVRPALQEVARVYDSGAGKRWGGQPGAVGKLDLQAALAVVEQ